MVRQSNKIKNSNNY